MGGRPVRVCLAGATGWTGAAVARGLLAAEDLVLVSAVARATAGRDLGEVLGGAHAGVPVRGRVVDALDHVDVLVDYTAPAVVKEHVLAAVGRGVCAVVGTSGLTADDYTEIDAAARANNVGVIAAGNFALTAALVQAAAALAARVLPQWEVIDYANSTKVDVPSGTARELAERLAEIRVPDEDVPLSDVWGPREARGADVSGVRVHSVRLPGFVVSTEVVFGLPDERLVIRHDAGGSPEPYVRGTLEAVRAVVGRRGLARGLDFLLSEDEAPGGPAEAGA